MNQTKRPMHSLGGPTVVRLQGGLGNQMFQYAFGRALMRRTRHDVLFDDSSYDTDALRAYELGVWRVSVPKLPRSQRDRLPRRYGGHGAFAWSRLRRPLRPVTEKPMGFRPEFLDPRPATYLSGYWQSEAFFADAADEVRAAFRPTRPLSSATARVHERLDATNAVAIHVRRTDYLRLPPP